MNRPRRRERGQALLLVIWSLVLFLFGFLGFAIDVGLLYREKQILQTAADSAAVAAAQQVVYSDWKAAALAAATQNGITNGTNGATVTVNHPPLSGPYTGNSSYVEVIVSQTQPNGFYRLVHPSVISVSARSVATNGPSHNCLYTLGTGTTDISITAAFTTLNFPNCGIIDNSSSGSALSLSGFVDAITAATITVVGQVSNGWGFLNTFTCTSGGTCPATGAAPTPDPLAGLVPTPSPGSCTSGMTTITKNTTLNPGCWNGLTLSGGTINFNPGVYYINNGGSLNFYGANAVNGTGVTFYVTGPINFTGAQYLNLVAPTSGSYNGMLFFAPVTNTSAMSFTGIQLSTLSGIVYLPGAGITWEGISSTTFNNSIIVKTFTFTGVGSVNDYAMVNPGTPLTGTRVVE